MKRWIPTGAVAQLVLAVFLGLVVAALLAPLILQVTPDPVLATFEGLATVVLLVLPVVAVMLLLLAGGLRARAAQHPASRLHRQKGL